MSTRYEMTYEVPMDMLQRAMTSWAQPNPSFAARAKRFGLVILGGVILGAALALSGVFDLLPEGFWTGALVGFYIGLAFWFAMHKRSTGKLSAMVASHLARQGPATGVFSENGVEISTRHGTSLNNWSAYDQVILMKDATALRAGGMIYPVPHAALPTGVTPEVFHADITRWQEDAA